MLLVTIDGFHNATLDLPVFDIKSHLRKELVLVIAAPRFDDLCDEITQIIKAQEKLIGLDVSHVTVKGNRYGFPDKFGIDSELDPTLQCRLDNWIELSRKTEVFINMLTNYITALLNTGKHHKDHLALLPQILHNTYTTVVRQDSMPIYFAHCWKPEPTLSPAQIQAFHERHRSVIRDIKCYHLNSIVQ